MKLEESSQFTPVHLVLESQDEIDVICEAVGQIAATDLTDNLEIDILIIVAALDTAYKLLYDKRQKGS